MKKNDIFFTKPLTEAICVVLLGIILSIGGFIGFSEALEQIRLQRLNTQIHLITGRMKFLFLEQPITTLTTQELFSLGVLKKQDYINGKTIHPFSKGHSPNGILFHFKKGDSFSLTWTNLPKKACVFVTTHSFGYSVSLELKKFQLNNLVFEKKDLPFSVLQAKQNCNKNNNLTWNY